MLAVFSQELYMTCSVQVAGVAGAAPWGQDAVGTGLCSRPARSVQSWAPI